MNIWVLVISVIAVFCILIALNVDDIYHYLVYVNPIKTVIISDEAGPPHVDAFKIGINAQNNTLPFKDVEFIAENQSINVTFGSGESFSRYFGETANFTHTQNFKPSQTFVFHCDERQDSTFLGFYKYLGLYMIHGDPTILFWHYEGHTQRPLTCEYPEIIINSVDLVDYDYASIIDALAEHPLNDLPDGRYMQGFQTGMNNYVLVQGSTTNRIDEPQPTPEMAAIQQRADTLFAQEAAKYAERASLKSKYDTGGMDSLTESEIRDLNRITNELRNIKTQIDQLNADSRALVTISQEDKSALYEAQILINESDIPYTGMSSDWNNEALAIGFETQELADQYAPQIDELIDVTFYTRVHGYIVLDG